MIVCRVWLTAVIGNVIAVVGSFRVSSSTVTTTPAATLAA
jgi:hypothetical protein